MNAARTLDPAKSSRLTRAITRRTRGQAHMPSTRIHVGNDEVLVDDSLRYVERAVAAGVDARAEVWMGMPHGFPGSIGRLEAAAQALDAIGAFLAERLQAHASP